MAPKSTSGFAYTKNEEEWFRIAAADFVKWQAKRKADEEDADTRFFVSRTLSAWYESFPERHPRTYRQHSESAEEAARMLLGPEMLRMHEVRVAPIDVFQGLKLLYAFQRIRHKLNYNKRFLTAEDLVRSQIFLCTFVYSWVRLRLILIDVLAGACVWHC